MTLTVLRSEHDATVLTGPADLDLPFAVRLPAPERAPEISGATARRRSSRRNATARRAAVVRG